MRTTALLAVVSALLFISAPIAHAQVTLDFDSLGCRDVVTNQFPEAIFSSEPGFEVVTDCFPGSGTSAPNYLCGATVGGFPTCENDIYVDFPVPVGNLQFLIAADNIAGVIGTVKVFVQGALFDTVDMVPDGDPFTADVIDLSAFGGVTRIEIGDLLDQVFFDDFSFTPAVCRGGNVNAGAGAVTDVLFVNGDPRRAIVGTGDPITVGLQAAPLGPASGADYVLWAWVGQTPNPMTLDVVTGVIGCTANPTPFQPFEGPQPFIGLNGGMPEVFTAGLNELGGAPASAPWSLTRNSGLGRAATFLLQAVLEDDGADNATGYSASNIVVLEIR